jgi:multidrug transporter EmrE-like cation transporter
MFTQLLFGLLILVSVGLNTAGQILLKQGATHAANAIQQEASYWVAILNVPLLSGLVAYGLSTVFYIGVLSKLNLSMAYPIVIGLTVISTVMAGAILFTEKVPTVGWVGVGFILSGISAIAFGKIS